MPVQIHREAAGIYRAEWLRNVTIEEVITEMNTVRDLVREHDEDHYHLLVDWENVTNIPFDLGNLRKIATSDERLDAFIIIKASAMASLLGKMINQLTEKNFHFVDTRAEALKMANNLLKQSS